MKPISADPLRTAVFTGTFDPITLGHLDVIGRGCFCSSTWSSPSASISTRPRFSTSTSASRWRDDVVRPFPNVSVESFEGLTVHFVKRIGARVILRGLRTLSDMEYEFGMTLTNHRLDPRDRDGLPDGRRRVLARLEHADQAGRVLRRDRSLKTLRARGVDRADPGQTLRSIHRQPRGMNRSRDHCRKPRPRARKSSCSVLTAFQARSKLEYESQPAKRSSSSRDRDVTTRVVMIIWSKTSCSVARIAA